MTLSTIGELRGAFSTVGLPLWLTMATNAAASSSFVALTFSLGGSGYLLSSSIAKQENERARASSLEDRSLAATQPRFRSPRNQSRMAPGRRSSLKSEFQKLMLTIEFLC